MRDGIQLRRIVALAAVVAGGAALADQPEDGELVNVDARYVFSPIGFDDNDEVEVVVDGYLPSGCYRLMRPEVQKDAATRTITIKPMARYFDVPCIEALVPYNFEVHLGQLDEGAYKIVVDGPRADLQEGLPVKRALLPGPDDYLYAPVDEVTVDEDRASGKLYATVQGRFTTTCMSWGEAQLADNGKTINLLPILKIDQAAVDDGRCEPAETYYKQRIELPASIQPGRHMLHVRSLNGQSANRLFFKPKADR